MKAIQVGKEQVRERSTIVIPMIWEAVVIIYRDGEGYVVA